MVTVYGMYVMRLCTAPCERLPSVQQHLVHKPLISDHIIKCIQYFIRNTFYFIVIPYTVYYQICIEGCFAIILYCCKFRCQKTKNYLDLCIICVNIHIYANQWRTPNSICFQFIIRFCQIQFPQIFAK